MSSPSGQAEPLAGFTFDSGTPELVLGQILDPLDEGGAAPESRADLGVVRSGVTPAKHTSLQRPEHIVTRGLTFLRSGDLGQGDHATDHLRAAMEPPSDLPFADPFADHAQDPALERPQQRPRGHRGFAIMLMSSSWPTSEERQRARTTAGPGVAADEVSRPSEVEADHTSWSRPGSGPGASDAPKFRSRGARVGSSAVKMSTWALLTSAEEALID